MQCTVSLFSVATSDQLLTSPNQSRWVIKSLMESIAQLAIMEPVTYGADSKKSVTLQVSEEVDTAVAGSDTDHSRESHALNASRSTSSPTSTVNIRNEQTRSANSSMIADHRPARASVDRSATSRELCRMRNYTAEEQSCIGVRFPPFFVSTHGLTRPSSPDGRDAERSVTSEQCVVLCAVLLICRKLFYCYYCKGVS